MKTNSTTPTDSGSGDDARADASASQPFSVAPSPATTSNTITHRVCAWCLDVLDGDPATVSKPGANITHVACPDCRDKHLAIMREQQPVDMREAKIIALTLRVTHATAVESLQQIAAAQEEQGWPDADALQPEMRGILKESATLMPKLMQVQAAFSLGPLRNKSI